MEFKFGFLNLKYNGFESEHVGCGFSTNCNKIKISLLCGYYDSQKVQVAHFILKESIQ